MVDGVVGRAPTRRVHDSPDEWPIDSSAKNTGMRWTAGVFFSFMPQATGTTSTGRGGHCRSAVIQAQGFTGGTVGFVHQRRVPGSRAQIIVAVGMTMPTAQTHPVGHGQPDPGQSDGAGGTAQAAKTAISIKDAATTKRLPMSLCRSRRIAAAKKRTE